jgi:hypothetical protein
MRFAPNDDMIEKPSRLGIFTFGSVSLSSLASGGRIPFKLRMYAVSA